MSESVAGAVARVQAPVLSGPYSLAATLAEASDIPRSCAGCRWRWGAAERRWRLIQRHGGCPWHGSPERQW